jgi:hypothetical protein
VVRMSWLARDPPALICAAFRVENPSLFWFVAAAWYKLAARHPDVDVMVTRAVDSVWQFRSDSQAYRDLVSAVTMGGITCVNTQTIKTQHHDILIDNIGKITLARRDKVVRLR